MTLYEQAGSNNRQNPGICMARIMSVTPETRTCEITTISSVQRLNDLRIKNCQWLSLSTHPSGDEFTIVPRPDSLCLCFLIDGTAYVWGFVKPLGPKGSLANGSEQAPVTEGDYLIATSGGNRITIKSNGLIELFSSDSLKRILMPNGRKIYDICSSMYTDTSCGYAHWELDEIEQTSLHDAEYRANLFRTTIVREQKGFVDATTAYQMDIGTGVPGQLGVPLPLYSKTIGVDGTLTIEVGPAGAGCSIEVTPEGQVTVKNLVGDISVESQAGNVSVKTELGNITAETTAGEVMLTGSQAKLKLGKGMVGIGGPAAELLDLFEQTLTKIDALLTAIQSQTHPTAVGPSGPPTNLADFIKAQVDFKVIAGLLASIKGGI